MTGKTSRKSCLNAEPHENDIRNPLLHYLGCIEIGEREEFLIGNSNIWEKEFKHQLSLQDVESPSREEDAQNKVQKMKDSWRSTIENEMGRIAFLRHTLSKDEHDGQLVNEVNKSYNAWRKSGGYPTRLGETTEREEVYTPEKDISVPVIHFKDYNGFTDRADKNLRGTFPNQKTTIAEFLKKDIPRLEANRMRYFHIPSNNMIWAEEAIAKYYGDAKPDFTAIERQLGRPQKNSTYMILQERYWRGQLHGDPDSPPHARYMSPMCEAVSASNKSTSERNNIVLFTPYLHWETSIKQQQFADEIDRIVLQAARDKREEENKAKETRQGKRQKSSTVAREPFPKIATPEKPIEGIDDVYHEHRRVHNLPSRLRNGRTQCTNALGRYLLAAAHLYEGMTTYRDKMLLRKYLPEDPPIHPRRTLDQAFYWTLNSTKKRDKDQVIYRSTTVTHDNLHRYDHKQKEWPDHKGLENRDCETCRSNMKKLSRVVMVDQLWMWILDGQTLITCFPKRYGANKQDYSGVHKSIRTSLENLDSNQPRTVFELALIVLDECTKTFFDRAKLRDRQPQVIDEFSKAIGNIMHKQTMAFTRLWRWTDEARKIFRSKGYTDTSGLHIPLLDINPEGKLEREIEDIIEELDIMLHITNIHKDIVQTFVRQAEQILCPNEPSKQPTRHPEETAKSQEKQEDYRSFKLRAQECQERVNGYVKDLESLRRSAKNAADDVLHLLTMKQQQASVVQAWQAVKQSDETIKQGRSIMVFTLATIVFLPLSFLTSVFGMNNQEFGNNNWSLKQQLLYIFTISAGVVFISLLFAFSAWTRAWAWAFYSRISIGFVTNTGIFAFFLGRKHSDQIFLETGVKVDGMKMGVRKEVLAKKQRRREECDMQGLQMGMGTGTPSTASSESTRLAGSLRGLRREFIDWRRRKPDVGNGMVGEIGV
ncbi:hypothetical protein F4678DRAFT_454429 [Xylaria arbuscula]|nr:hypothetical protein F4678DRAFT_454429 [Xylaria arbuscula]